MSGEAKSFLTPKRDDSQIVLDWKAAAYLATGLGQAGVDHYADTASHTGNWWCIHAIGGDAVIEKVTYATGTSNTDLLAVTLANGDRIYGRITSVKLTSGRVEAYRAVVS